MSRQHTNLTPAQLEEFESTFRYFDKDASNTLTVPELGAALASLGIVYTEEDIEQIHFQLSQNFGSVSYVSWLRALPGSLTERRPLRMPFSPFYERSQRTRRARISCSRPSKGSLRTK